MIKICNASLQKPTYSTIRFLNISNKKDCQLKMKYFILLSIQIWALLQVYWLEGTNSTWPIINWTDSNESMQNIFLQSVYVPTLYNACRKNFVFPFVNYTWHLEHIPRNDPNSHWRSVWYSLADVQAKKDCTYFAFTNRSEFLSVSPRTSQTIDFVVRDWSSLI